MKDFLDLCYWDDNFPKIVEKLHKLKKTLHY